MWLSTWLSHKEPRFWLDVILDVPVRRLTCELADWAEQTALPKAGRPHPIHWSPEQSKKKKKKRWKKENVLSLPDCLSWDITVPLHLGSKSGLEHMPLAPLVPRPLTQAGPIPSAPARHPRSLGLPSLRNPWSQLLTINLSLSRWVSISHCLSLHWFCFPDLTPLEWANAQTSKGLAVGKPERRCEPRSESRLHA